MGRKISFFFTALVLSLMVLIPAQVSAQSLDVAQGHPAPASPFADEDISLIARPIIRPHIENFQTKGESPFSTRVPVSADVAGLIKNTNIKFYIRNCNDRGKKLLPIKSSKTHINNTYFATFNTEGMDGDYCVFATLHGSTANLVARDAQVLGVQEQAQQGNSVHDKESIRITIDNTPPEAPSLISPPDEAVVNGASITQSWSNVSDADHYVYNSYHDSMGTNLRYANTYTATSKTATNVADSTYYWRVKAVDAAGNESVWSNLWKLTVDSTSPETPTGLTILDHEGTDLGCEGYTTNRRITVDWTDNTESDLSHYEYDVKDRMNLAYPTVSHYTGNIRNEDGHYKYRVRAVDQIGNTSDSTEWCHVTLDRVGPEVSFYGLRHIDKNSNNVDTTEVITNDNTPIVLITASDVTSDVTEVYVNGVLATFDGTYWVAQLITELPDGSNVLTVRAIDMAGNETIISPKIFIDTAAPTATFQHYIDGDLFTGDIAYVNNVSQLTFTGEYFDAKPSSGLYADSFVIFEAQDDGSFKFSADGKQAFCSWRSVPNMLKLKGPSYNKTTPVNFDLCISTLPDGEYYMAHHIYDHAIRKDIPSINQFRDVLGLHFIVDSTAPSIPGSLSYELPGGEPLSCGSSTDSYNIVAKWESSTDANGISHYEYQSFNPPTGWIWGPTNVTTNHRAGSFSVGEGTYGFRVRAVDMLGNKSDWSALTFENSCQITYDSTAPSVLGISDQSINEGDILPTGITTTATDNLGVTKFYYKIDNSLWGTTYGSIDNPTSTVDVSQLIIDKINDKIAPATATVVDTSLIPEGTYTFSYFVEDSAGNRSAEYSFNYTINNVAPTAVLSASATNITEGDSINFSLTFTDPSDTGTNTPDDSDWTYTFLTDDGLTLTGTVTNDGTIISSYPHTYTTAGTYIASLEVCEASDPGENQCHTDTVTINVEAPAVLGENTETTQTVTTITPAAGTGDATPPADETPEEGGIGGGDEEVLGEITNGDVKGAQTCEEPKKISGYIYVDKNDNNKKDENEQTFENISLTIYYEDEDGKTVVKEVTTDENGYWETTICPGMYKIEIDKTNLPKNFDTEFSDVLGVTVPESVDEVQADIYIVDERNFWQKNWPWIVLGIAALGVVALLLVDRRREE